MKNVRLTFQFIAYSLTYIRIIFLNLFLCLSLLLLFSNGVLAQTNHLDLSFNPKLLREGYILTTAFQSDGKTLIGGQFNDINGIERNYIARINADGTLDSGFTARFDSSVSAIAVQSDGKIFVGGYFGAANLNYSRFNLARLNADGSVDGSFKLSPNGNVSAVLAQPDGKILVAGSFSGFLVNNAFVARKDVARFNQDGTLDDSFTLGSGTDGTVNKIVIQPGGKIILAGSFSSINGVARRNIARVNPNGEVDQTFNMGLDGTSILYGLAVQPDGKIIVCGIVDISGQSRSIARFSVDGTLEEIFNPTSNSAFDSVSVQADGKIYVGGSFDTVNGGGRSCVARLNSDGSLDASFIPPIITDDPLRRVKGVNLISVAASGKVIIAGSFSSVGGTEHIGISRLNSDGTLDGNFSINSYQGGTVNKLAVQPDGRILVGGDFIKVNESNRKYLIRLQSDGTLDTSFNVTLNQQVSALVLQPDGKIVAGGFFTSVNSQTRKYLTRLNPDGTLDGGFSTGTGPSFAVRGIGMQPDGKLLIGGGFTSIDGTPANGIARLNPNGSLDSSFNAAVSNATNFTFTPDNKIVIGGLFSTVNGAARTGIARLHSDGSLDDTFNPVFSGASQPHPKVIQRPDGKLLVGGLFSTVNGTARSNIALLNGDGSLDLSFNAAADDRISSLLIAADGKIFVGGVFNLLNAAPRNSLGRLQGTSALDDNFNLLKFIPSPEPNIFLIYRGLNNGVNDLTLQGNNRLLAGGYFTDVTGSTRLGLARILLSPPAPFDFDGDSKTDIAIFRPSGGEWWTNLSATNQTVAAQFGASSDKPVPADFTGDGKTDVAFWRQSSGQWFILRSDNNSFYAFPFGANGDIPAPADYDGDGKADAAIFRPSNAAWYVLRSSDGQVAISQFGVSEDKPVVADYDGDGKSDIAVFRPSVAEWWILKSSGGIKSVQFGQVGDKAVAGDYTGDGKADIAFWRESNGFWYILRSENDSYYGFPFGASGDVPVPGDYDGDGKTDSAVFRSSNSGWYLNRSTAGFYGVQFGLSSDQPIPNSFVR